MNFLYWILYMIRFLQFFEIKYFLTQSKLAIFKNDLTIIYLTSTVLIPSAPLSLYVDIYLPDLQELCKSGHSLKTVFIKLVRSAYPYLDVIE